MVVKTLSSDHSNTLTITQEFFFLKIQNLSFLNVFQKGDKNICTELPPLRGYQFPLIGDHCFPGTLTPSKRDLL